MAWDLPAYQLCSNCLNPQEPVASSSNLCNVPRVLSNVALTGWAREHHNHRFAKLQIEDMGLFGRGRKEGGGKPKEEAGKPEAKATAAQEPAAPAKAEPVAAMPAETSVFEFGSASTGEEHFTLAGYCPVSDELEPCRWEVLPTGGAEAPKFRIIF